MVFNFALVIDFEASCYGPGERPPEGWKGLVQNLIFVNNDLWIIFASNNWSEITEFPAVLVNLSTEEIVSEFNKKLPPGRDPIHGYKLDTVNMLNFGWTMDTLSTLDLKKLPPKWIYTEIF